MKRIGWLGSIMLAICGAPQAIQAVMTGTSEGVNPYFLFLWGGGEVLVLIYVVSEHKADAPLVVNYIMNLLFIGIIAWYL